MKRVFAYQLIFILCFVWLAPQYAYAVDIDGQDIYYGEEYLFENMLPGESQEQAFLRLGRDFYDSYIKDKYIDDDHHQLFTLSSIYALEYAMNKDLMSDEAVEAITGKGGVVDKDNYSSQLNAFCAEFLPIYTEKRISTNLPDDLPDDISQITQPEDEREWGDGGIMCPEFSRLSLMGKDLWGCTSTMEFLFRYAVMERCGMREGDKENYDEVWTNYRDKDGESILGWVLRPDGKIAVQAVYTMSRSMLSGFYNTSGYGLVNSDGRYYLVKDSVLVTEPVTINFSKDFPLEAANWYEVGSPEDKDYLWTPDAAYGVDENAMESMIGEQNASYIYDSETIGFQKLFYVADMGLPVVTDGTEAQSILTLKNEGQDSYTLASMESAQLKVSVNEDKDGWFAGQLHFYSTDDTVAYVDDKGCVIGVSEGNAEILVTAKSAGRCRPLHISVKVTSSPAVTAKVPVGVVPGDSIFGGSSYNLDSLPEDMEIDGASAVILVDQPSFVLNGHYDFDPLTAWKAGDELQLCRRTRGLGCGTVPFEEYKRVAERLHEQGIKVYLLIQSWYGNSYGESVAPGTYWRSMVEAYAAGQKDEETTRAVDMIFEAEKGYFSKYADSYERAGIDGFILDNMGVYPNDINFIDDGHWSDLISVIRSNYNGEIKAMCYLNDNGVEPYVNNPDLYASIDGVDMICDYFIQRYFYKDNMNLAECKQALGNYALQTDKLHEAYPNLGIDSEWRITSTGKPCAILYAAGKGKVAYLDTDTWTQHKVTSADYLQQMIVWQAILEVFGTKSYTTGIYSFYLHSDWKGYDTNDTVKSGYDTTASVYRKPAAKIIRLWRDGGAYVPGAPEVPAVSTEEECIKLEWAAVEGAERYRIERKTEEENVWKTIGSSTVNSYIDRKPGCKDNVSYRISVSLRKHYSDPSGASESVNGPHHWITVIDRQPTAGADGLQHKECEVCGEMGASENIPALKGLSVSFDTDTIDITEDGKYETVYTGAAIKPEVIVKDGEELLRLGVDYTLKYSNNVRAGKAGVFVKGKGNYRGTATLEFTILQKDIGDTDVCLGGLIVKSGKKGAPVLAYGGKILKDGKDIKVSGDKTLTIEGTGSFTGKIEAELKEVTAAEYGAASIKAKFALSEKVFDGTEKLPGAEEIIVYDKSGKELQAGTDYLLSVSPAVHAGKVSLVVAGCGEYTGVVKKSYNIKPDKSSSITAVNTGEERYYSSCGTYPVLNVTLQRGAETVILKENTDYKLSCKGNKKAGETFATVSFIGDYKGHAALSGISYTIKPADFSKAELCCMDIAYKKSFSFKPSVFVDCEGQKPGKAELDIKYYDGDKEIKAGEKINLADGEKEKEIKVVVNGKGNYSEDSVEGICMIRRSDAGLTDLSRARIVCAADGKAIAAQSGTGGRITPEIKVQVKNGKQWVDVDAGSYSVNYVYNINKGSAMVIINGDGINTVGSRKTVFKIAAQSFEDAAK